VDGMSIRSLAVKVLIVSGVLAAYPVLAQQAEPHPTCDKCSAVYVPKSELDA
jgi:hypothetical protein